MSADVASSIGINEGLVVHGSKTRPHGRILLFSYAFPPMQVQMTPAVFKPMAAIARLGYKVDVLCADSFCPELPLDTSLLPHAERIFPNIVRLNPRNGFFRNAIEKSVRFSRIPDLMAVLHQSAYQYLMDVDLSCYDAVMTWSPFHSVNPVMVRVKKERKNVRWIAQFSDPWAGNPLEVNRLSKLWNKWHEPRTVQVADYIVHSSAYSLDLMLQGHSNEILRKTAVLPHVFNKELYPQRPKEDSGKILMRYAGVLYGRRSPEPVFAALNKLFDRRKDLRDNLVLELIGQVPPDMLQTAAAKSLPVGTIRHVSNVDYLRSLELMYDADMLLLIEADVSKNLFLASKVSDYVGANTPIVGLVPPGASEDALVGLGAWYSRPTDIDGIANSIERAAAHVCARDEQEWCNVKFRNSFDSNDVAKKFLGIIKSF